MIHLSRLKNFIIILCLSLLLSAAGCSKTQDLSPPGNNITCYAAAYNKGVYKSDNSGISWYPMISEQEDISFYSKRLFLSPDAKSIYVATSGNGLFSIDMGKGILSTVNNFKDDDVRSIVFKEAPDGQAAGIEIYAAIKDTGINRKASGRDTWDPFNNGLTYRDVNVLFKGPGSIFAGTVNGVFKLDDASGIWKDSSEGMKNRNITAINSDPGGNPIYTGSGAYQSSKGRFENIPCLYKSADRGRTWAASDKGIPDGTLVFCIAVNPARPERIYVGTNRGIYRSVDGGGKWSKTAEGLPDNFIGLDIKITGISGGKELVYAAGVNGLYMTLDDKSQGWTSRSYGLDQTYISSILLMTGTEN